MLSKPLISLIQEWLEKEGSVFVEESVLYTNAKSHMNNPAEYKAYLRRVLFGGGAEGYGSHKPSQPLKNESKWRKFDFNPADKITPEEMDKIKADYDAMVEEKKAALLKEMDSKLKTVIKSGVKNEVLKGKSYDYILGRFDQLAFDSKHKSGVRLEDANQKDGDSKEFFSTNDYVWNGKEYVK